MTSPAHPAAAERYGRAAHDAEAAGAWLKAMAFHRTAAALYRGLGCPREAGAHQSLADVAQTRWDELLDRR